MEPGLMTTERILGTGAMGEVFLVTDSQGTPFALKVLKNRNEKLINLFEQEVEILSKLKHPRLVEIEGFSKKGDGITGIPPAPCFWMEYIDGDPLLQAAQKTDFSQILKWFRESLEALEYLHAQGILHGDLKPANVLVQKDGHIKLVDFGLATLTQNLKPTAGVAKGSIPYLAPEVLEGRQLPASDLFSLGTVFYQALTGRHPRAAAKNLKDLFSTDIPKLNEIIPQVPPQTARVLDRLIEPDLKFRLKTAQDALEALTEADWQETRTEEDFHSFQMFGTEELRKKFFNFKKAAETEGHRGLVLLHGLTGVGKTRFIRELFFELALRGDNILQTRANPQKPLLVDLFGETPPADGDSGNFVVQIISSGQDLSPQQLRDLYRFLLQSHERPGLLILEYNDEALPEIHKDFFSNIALEERALDLPLKNLDLQDTREFLTLSLRTELPEDIVRELFQRTQGNPKLLTELCREILKTGILRKKRLTPALFQELALPKNSRELYQRRLANLTTVENKILNYIALAFGSVGLDQIVSLSEMPLEELRLPLSHLNQLSLLKWDSETDVEKFAISHPSLGALIQENLSPEKKIELHRNWLTLLEKTPPKNRENELQWVVPLAHHALEIPRQPHQFQWLSRAGNLLTAHEDHEKALSLYLKGLKQIHQGEEREPLLRAAANTYGRLGRFKEALPLVETWFREFGKEATGLNEVKYWISTAVNFQNQGNLPEARRRFETCIRKGNPANEQHRSFIARAHSLLGLLYIQEENFERANQEFKQALSLLPEESIQTAEVLKHQAVGSVHQGDWDSALRYLEKARKMYQTLDHPIGLFSVALERGNSAIRLGKILEAQEAYTQALEIAFQNKEEAELARAYQNLGVVACRTGQFARAIDVLEKAREIFSMLGNLGDLGMNLMQLALAYASVGRFTKSESLLILPRRQQNLSPSFQQRLEKVEFQISVLRWGQVPHELKNPLEEKKLADLEPVDSEGRLLLMIQSNPEKDASEIAQILTEIHDRLPDSLKISFEDRGDYRRFVLKETVSTDEEKLKTSYPEKKGKNAMDILQKVAEITKELLATSDIDKVLIRLMDAAMDFSKAEHGFLILKSEKEKGPFPGFEIKVARNLAKEEIENEDFRLSISAVKEALKTGTPLVTDNALQDVRFEAAESVHQMELKSILALPLKGTTGLVGALYLDHPYKTDIFQEADLNILQILADQAALALQKAQMIADLRAANSQLNETVEDQASEISFLKREVEDQRAQLQHEYKDIIGTSPAMLEVLSMVDRVTETKVPVWIYGESGTGKEMIARALHFNSSRGKGPFVSENCSALPETLLESELFGHKRGAFTHADRDKKGLLEHANKGTVFLDEIADMSPSMQAKLLRFLQEGEIRPLGSNQVIKVDVRVVSASNRDLQALVAEDKFREDLYYRLNGVTIVLPPLRNRLEDIPLLAKHFLKKIAKEEASPELEITADALEQLMEYPWPGNVRELENTLRTAMLFHQKGKITPKSFNFKKQLTGGMVSTRPTPLKQAAQNFETAKATHPSLPEEKKLLLQALYDAGFHKGHAAKALGISRRYLYTQLLRHQVPVNRIEMKAYIEENLGIR